MGLALGADSSVQQYSCQGYDLQHTRAWTCSRDPKTGFIDVLHVLGESAAHCLAEMDDMVSGKS
jgi:hypothetical protein